MTDEKVKIQPGVVRFLESSITTLKEQENVFKAEINKYYYKCYANSSIQAEVMPNKTVAFVGNNVSVEKYI